MWNPRKTAWLIAGFLTLPAAPSPALAEGPTIEALRDWSFWNNSGWRALQRGDHINAERRFHEAIRVMRPYEKRDPRLLARSYGDLALVLYYQGRYPEAEPLAKWSLAIRETQVGLKPDAVFQSLYLLAVIHRGQRHYAEADPLLRRALALQEMTLGPDHANTALTLDALAGICCERSQYTEAESLYKRALAIREKTLPAEHPDLAETSEHYAVLLRRMNRNDEAADMEARVKAIQDAAATRAARTRSAQAGAGFQGIK
jgi:tetratricopeptide (TPR) repeat protein